MDQQPRLFGINRLLQLFTAMGGGQKPQPRSRPVRRWQDYISRLPDRARRAELLRTFAARIKLCAMRANGHRAKAMAKAFAAAEAEFRKFIIPGKA